jgi:hypothetical protein
MMPSPKDRELTLPMFAAWLVWLEEEIEKEEEGVDEKSLV